MEPLVDLRPFCSESTLIATCQPSVVLTQNDEIHRCIFARDTIESAVGTLFHHVGFLSIFEGYFNFYWFESVLLAERDGVFGFIEGVLERVCPMGPTGSRRSSILTMNATRN